MQEHDPIFFTREGEIGDGPEIAHGPWSRPGFLKMGVIAAIDGVFGGLVQS